MNPTEFGNYTSVQFYTDCDDLTDWINSLFAKVDAEGLSPDPEGEFAEDEP